MPTGPRPMTKAQLARLARAKRIWELKRDGFGWPDIAVTTGATEDACKALYNRALKAGHFEALPDDRGNAVGIERSDPAKAGEMAAVAVVQAAEDDKLRAMRAAMKEAGCHPKMIDGFLRRLRATLGPVMEDAKRLTLAQLNVKLEEKISLVLNAMDEYDVTQAGLKDKSIALGILIDRHQVINNRPTQIIDITARMALPDLMREFAAEAHRRGVTIDSTAVLVPDGPR